MILIVEQVYIFMYAILAGAIAAFLYDLLRIKRRAIKTGVILVSLEDILFWLVAAVLLFITVYNSNSGEMRGFIFIGNVIGVVLYETLLSNIIIKSSMMIINLIKRVFKFLWKVLSYPFKLAYKIIKIPISFIFRLLYKLFRLIGRGFSSLFRKADVKGKSKKLGRKAIALKSKAGGFTKKGFNKLKQRKKKTGEKREASGDGTKSNKAVKRKRKNKKRKKADIEQNKADTA